MPQDEPAGYEELNREFEKKDPREIVAWAVREFAKGLVIPSSFGPESGVLLHMASSIDPTVPVMFLETGYHVPEILIYKEVLTKLFCLTQVLRPKTGPAGKTRLETEGEGRPFEKSLGGCRRIGGAGPLVTALKEHKAWMSDVRRQQKEISGPIRILEQDESGLIRINPLANFTSRDVRRYLEEHHIPPHPLTKRGDVCPGEDGNERSGRWMDKKDKGNGIHVR